MKLKDLTGMKFGRLTVIERAESKNGRAYWKCLCDCGNKTVVRKDHLLKGSIQSCGCIKRELHTKHGICGEKVYTVWGGIIQRCTNPKNPGYKNYGGRGITVYPEWIDNFQAFYNYVSRLEHFGEKGYSLDRINNNEGYEPLNVRWADKTTQDRNKRSNHILEYNGKLMSLAEASEKSGINKNTLLKRVRHGDTGDYLFRPVKKR